jgi:hypothetical protein
VDVSLVGDIEDEFVGGSGENPVHGDAEFDYAEVRSEVATGDGEAFDEGFPYFLCEGDEIRFGKVKDVSGGLDGAQQWAKLGWRGIALVVRRG